MEFISERLYSARDTPTLEASYEHFRELELTAYGDSGQTGTFADILDVSLAPGRYTWQGAEQIRLRASRSGFPDSSPFFAKLWGDGVALAVGSVPRFLEVSLSGPVRGKQISAGKLKRQLIPALSPACSTSSRARANSPTLQARRFRPLRLRASGSPSASAQTPPTLRSGVW